MLLTVGQQLAHPPSSSRSSRIGAAVLAFVALWIPAALLQVPALIVYTYECDDGCGIPAQGWRFTSGAWQWSAQYFGLALPTLVLASAAVVLLGVGAARASRAAVWATLCTGFGWLLLPALTGSLQFSPTQAAIAIVLGVLAVRIAWARRPLHTDASAQF